MIWPTQPRHRAIGNLESTPSRSHPEMPRRTVRIATGQLRDGCALVLTRVNRHATDAEHLLEAGKPEGAFLLFLLGLEELGKVVHIIDAAQLAEANKSPEVALPEFLAHEPKGEHGAKNIALAIDLFIEPLRQAGLDASAMKAYVEHLRDIKSNFRQMREDMMYVDFRDNHWVDGRPPSVDLIRTDVGILHFARAVLMGSLVLSQNFQGFRTFADRMNQAVREFRRDLPGIIETIRTEAAKMANKGNGPGREGPA